MSKTPWILATMTAMALVGCVDSGSNTFYQRTKLGYAADNIFHAQLDACSTQPGTCDSLCSQVFALDDEAQVQQCKIMSRDLVGANMMVKYLVPAPDGATDDPDGGIVIIIDGDDGDGSYDDGGDSGSDDGSTGDDGSDDGSTDDGSDDGSGDDGSSDSARHHTGSHLTPAQQKAAQLRAETQPNSVTR